MVLWFGRVRSWVKKKKWDKNTRKKRFSSCSLPSCKCSKFEVGKEIWHSSSEGEWWDRKCLFLFYPVISILLYKLVTCSFHSAKLVVSSKNKKKGLENFFFIALSFQLKCVCVCTQSLSRVPTLFGPWTVAHQAPLSMEFSRQEYWSGLPFATPGGLPYPGIEPPSPALAGRCFTTAPSGSPFKCLTKT